MLSLAGAVGTGLSRPGQRVRPKEAHFGTSHGSLPASKLCRYVERPLQRQVKLCRYAERPLQLQVKLCRYAERPLQLPVKLCRYAERPLQLQVKLCRYAERPLQLQVKAPCAAPAHIPSPYKGRSRPRRGRLVPASGTEWWPGHPPPRPWRPTYHRSPQMLGGLDRAGDAQCLSVGAGPPGRGKLLSGAKKERPHRKGPGASES